MEWNFQWDTDGKKWLKGYAETSQHSLLAVIVFLLIFKVDFFTLPVMFYVMEILELLPRTFNVEVWIG